MKKLIIATALMTSLFSLASAQSVDKKSPARNPLYLQLEKEVGDHELIESILIKVNNYQTLNDVIIVCDTQYKKEMAKKQEIAESLKTETNHEDRYHLQEKLQYIESKIRSYSSVKNDL